MNSTSISVHFTTVAKKIEKKISSKSEFTDYLPHPNRDSLFLDPTTKEEIKSEIKTLKTNKSSVPSSIPTYKSIETIENFFK